MQPSALFASHVEINWESVQRKIEILRPNHKNIFYISCDQLSPLASPRRTPLLYNHVFYVKGDFLPPTIGPGNHLHMGVQRNSHLILGYSRTAAIFTWCVRRFVRQNSRGDKKAVVPETCRQGP